jgi:hypothetical protein
MPLTGRKEIGFSTLSIILFYMKTLTQKFAILTLSLFVFGSSAFAVDQVVLTNGSILEGKVLNDVPNRYVDIELLNGTKQRVQRTEVANVERDVPSTKDDSMMGVESRMYLGVLGGLSVAKDASSTAISTTSFSQFDYGARFGVNAMQLGNFGKLAFGLSFDRFAEGTDPNIITTTTNTFMTIAAQILFRKVANSGFYFGAEAGLGIISQNSLLTNTTASYNVFTGGGLLGYDFYVTPTFSFGPEIHYDNFGAANSNGFAVTDSTNIFKFLLNLTLNF